MKYRVHRIDINKTNMQEKLAEKLNQVEGEVISVVPHVTHALLGLGGAAKVDFLLIVEKVN